MEKFTLKLVCDILVEKFKHAAGLMNIKFHDI